MKTFEIGKIYKSKTFLGYDCQYKCVARTNKTVKLYDILDKEEYTKRIKSNSNGEYVVFSAGFMGYCEMEIKA